jgi:RND family efflux transporter MFP subunit
MVSPVSAGGGFTRTGISTIVDMSSLEIEVDVNESHIAKIYPGQPAEATLDAYPDWRIPATVRTIIPTADRQKATVKVRLRFNELDPRILPDMGVKVAFHEPIEDSVQDQAPQSLIPAAAVVRTEDSTAVFVVADGMVERRAVAVGREIGNDVEVLSGLAPGEQVAVSGLAEIGDGDRVRIED